MHGWRLKIAALDFCNRLLLIDSTFISLNEKLAATFRGSGGAASSASCKIQILLDLLSGQIQWGEITEGNKPDQSYAERLVELLKPKDFIIFDLGYFKLKFLEALIEGDCYFLTRLLFGRKLLDPSSKKELKFSEFPQGQTVDRDVFVVFGSKLISCRLISLPVPLEVAQQRRRKVSEDVRRTRGKTPTAERLQYCDRTTYITNVDPGHLSIHTLETLYRLRWQIEIFFKILKSVFKIGKISTASEPRLRCHLLGRIILAVIVYRTHSHLNASLYQAQNYEVSVQKFAKRFTAYISNIANCLNSNLKSDLQLLKNLLRAVLNYATKFKQHSRKTPLEMLKNVSSFVFEEMVQLYA